MAISEQKSGILGSSNGKYVAVSDKLSSLKKWFRSYDSALVAFSSGVDSTLLAYAAYSALSKNAIAVTSVSPSFSSAEQKAAVMVAKEIGIELIIVSQDDLGTLDYVVNNVNRCYFCRVNLVKAILPIAKERNISVLVDGTHIEDVKSPRPGVKALRESGFKAPYVDLGFDKEDIRAMAKLANLSNADKPSEACLSSRIAYGQSITEKTLRQIESAESFLSKLVGAKVIRVRTISTKALIELDIDSIPKARDKISLIEQEFGRFGYTSVEIDPHGYSPGHMLQLFVHDEAQL